MAQHPAYSILWHLTLFYELHGQQCQNGFYFSNRQSLHDQETWIDSATSTLANHFYNFAYPKFKAFQNQEVHYQGIIVTTLNPQFGKMHELTISVGAGEQPDESLPSSISAILSCRTGFGGKSSRGRIYIPGVSENDHEGSELDPDSFTALHDIGNELSSLYGSSGSQGILAHVIYSKKIGYSNGIYNVSGIKQITHYIPRRVLGTNRHRLKGKGN